MGKGKRLRETRTASVTEARTRCSRPRAAGVTERWFYILRYIAMIVMLIDHLSRVLYVTGKINAMACVVCYIIGRMAFPLFAFELVESFYHTKHKVKHLIWLGGLALVSEIPFDMALVMTDPLMKLDMETFLDIIAYQNVCIALFFGFLMLLLCDVLDALIHRLLNKHRYIGWTLSAILKVAVYLGVGLAVGFLRADYSWHGTTLIALFAIGRGHANSRWKAKTSASEKYYASSVVMAWQGAAILWFGFTYGTSYIVFVPLLISLTLIYIAQVQSEKAVEKEPISNTTKYFCRVYYPVHLILLTVAKGMLTGWTPFSK